MFIFKAPPILIRSTRPIVQITERLGSASCQSSAQYNIGVTRGADDNETNAVVLDARSAKSLSDLTWLYEKAKKHADSSAFRKPGGRVVILRSWPDSRAMNPETAAVSEAIVGFAKSLAKENGSRGATVNLIRDSTCTDNQSEEANSCSDDPVDRPLEWLLSSASCYVTGQELVVTSNSNKSKRPGGNGAIVITGAAGAIGKATAEFLASENGTQQSATKFLLVDHPSSESKLKTVADDIVNKSTSSESDNADTGDLSPPIINTLPLDIAQVDAGTIIAEAGTRLGGLERVIHAAGITRDKTLRNMSFESSWLPVLQVNLQASISIDKALLSTPGALFPRDDSGGGSSFVYISSTSGIAGNAGQSNYAATKSGLLGYAQAMGCSYPEHAFRVVSPGFIQTDMTQKMPFLVRLVASRLNALGQAGQAQDVAAAIAFLSSKNASGLAPGFNLRVCGMFMGGR